MAIWVIKNVFWVIVEEKREILSIETGTKMDGSVCSVVK